MYHGLAGSVGSLSLPPFPRTATGYDRLPTLPPVGSWHSLRPEHRRTHLTLPRKRLPLSPALYSKAEPMSRTCPSAFGGALQPGSGDRMAYCWVDR